MVKPKITASFFRIQANLALTKLQIVLRSRYVFETKSFCWLNQLDENSFSLFSSECPQFICTRLSLLSLFNFLFTVFTAVIEKIKIRIVLVK